MTSALDVLSYGDPPAVAVEIPPLTLPNVEGLGRGLASAVAANHARREMGVEPGVRFPVHFHDGTHYGVFVFGLDGWRWA